MMRSGHRCISPRPIRCNWCAQHITVLQSNHIVTSSLLPALDAALPCAFTLVVIECVFFFALPHSFNKLWLQCSGRETSLKFVSWRSAWTAGLRDDRVHSNSGAQGAFPEHVSTSGRGWDGHESLFLCRTILYIFSLH